MTKSKNDIYYVAALIEFVARQTKNRRSDIARCLGVEGIREQYRFADVSHCLSFEQVSDETIEEYHIETGDFCPEDEEQAPSFLAIGRSYADLVENAQPDTSLYPEELYKILTAENAL